MLRFDNVNEPDANQEVCVCCLSLKANLIGFLFWDRQATLILGGKLALHIVADPLQLSCTSNESPLREHPGLAYIGESAQQRSCGRIALRKEWYGP